MACAFAHASLLGVTGENEVLFVSVYFYHSSVHRMKLHLSYVQLIIYAQIALKYKIIVTLNGYHLCQGNVMIIIIIITRILYSARKGDPLTSALQSGYILSPA